LPQLAAKGALRGRVYDGFFLDIGVPDAYARAPELIERSVRRPALFLDRDGVLNVDKGHVGTVDRFEWIPGARESVKAANDAGSFVFVVTNQAGIAKGHYTEADMYALHEHMQQELRAIGAHVDAIRYCPMHPDGLVPSFRGSSDWRKPAPGMILDLLAKWPVNVDQSLLVGDKPSDLDAGRLAGVSSFLFEGGRVDHFVESLQNVAAGK
jgi:D,D-heptose 1,7-bisphosphate phosphatase